MPLKPRCPPGCTWHIHPNRFKQFSPFVPPYASPSRDPFLTGHTCQICYVFERNWPRFVRLRHLPHFDTLLKMMRLTRIDVQRYSPRFAVISNAFRILHRDYQTARHPHDEVRLIGEILGLLKVLKVTYGSDHALHYTSEDLRTLMYHTKSGYHPPLWR